MLAGKLCVSFLARTFPGGQMEPLFQCGPSQREACDGVWV